MKRVLICGYYGFDNAGDEAVLGGIIAGLDANPRPAAFEVQVLSIAPERTTALHAVAAFHRYSDFYRPIAGCSLFLSGGGSLLQDVTSAHGIFYYLAMVRLAQILGRKTMFIAQGIGPLIRPSSRKLTASVANRLDAITVRDNDSAELLRGIGVTKPMTVTADPALLLTAPTVKSRSGIRLSMRPWPSSNNLNETIASALTAGELGSKVSPLNMYGSGDREAAESVLKLIGNLTDPVKSDESQPSYKDLLLTAASSEMLLGMRLHALIFAAASSIPSVALSYDPKVSAFMRQSGQGDAIFDISSGTSNELQILLEQVWSERAERSNRLRSTVPDLRAKAMVNCSAALALLS